MRELRKTRNIYLSTPISNDQLIIIRNELLNRKGISNIQLNRNGSLYVEYDLQKTNLQSIESALNKVNLKLSGSLLNRLKRGWLHFTEQNEYDNMHGRVQLCCSDPTENK